MSPPSETETKISEEDYLNGELNSDMKHEYIDAYVYTMSGASEKHNLITGNIFYEFSSYLKQQKSSCKTFMADMKVKVAEKMSNNFFYPDVMVVCDNQDKSSDYYKNAPVIIVEVLSKSTRKTDSSTKMVSYFNISKSVIPEVFLSGIYNAYFTSHLNLACTNPLLKHSLPCLNPQVKIYFLLFTPAGKGIEKYTGIIDKTLIY